MPAIERSQKKYYSISKLGKIRWKEGDTVMEAPAFAGHIRGVEYKEDEYQGEKIHRLHLTFRDHNGAEEILQCGLLASAGKSILNTIAGTDNPDHLEIAPYINTVGDKEYVNVYIKVNGQKGEWKYSPRDDFPRAVEVTLPSGKKVKDDANVLPFFIQLAEECDLKVKMLGSPRPAAPSTQTERPTGLAGAKVYGAGEASTPAGKKPDLNDWDSADDDLPF